MLAATAKSCKLNFYYRHEYPQLSDTTLNVLISSPSGFSKYLKSHHGNTHGWLKYEVHIGELPAGYHVEFSGDARVNDDIRPYIDMALDDIKFIDCDPQSNTAPLSTSSLSCDFEQDTCGWKNDDKDSMNKINWVKF